MQGSAWPCIEQLEYSERGSEGLAVQFTTDKHYILQVFNREEQMYPVGRNVRCVLLYVSFDGVFCILLFSVVYHLMEGFVS